MRAVVRTLAELGPSLVLAPERWLAAEGGDEGVPLADLVTERRERPPPDAVVLDTTHAHDGLLDIASALRASGGPRADTGGARAVKKLARAGDLVVSRLRPYLRQIAFVHDGALASVAPRALALSTEFYVLAPRDATDDLAFLLPFLLGARAQELLAAAQEGGHHPRVPRTSLLALRVPAALVQERRTSGRRVRAALGALYAASARYHELLAGP